MRDTTSMRQPEVSLITSWRVRVRDDEVDETSRGRQDVGLPGLELALAEGFNVLDLYLLDHHEIRVYAYHLGLSTEWEDWKNCGQRHDDRFATPAAFLASLTSVQLESIADFLREKAVQYYVGRNVGRRPRFAAIATYLPQLSLPISLPGLPDEVHQSMVRHRDLSIKALRAALYLADQLGCHCVEAVGGSRVPQPHPFPDRPGHDWSNWTPDQYKSARLSSLVDAVRDVFFAVPPGFQHFPRLRDTPPFLALELEPGPSYLLNDMRTFYEAWLRLPEDVQSRVGLNADLAHFLLMGINSPEHMIVDPVTKQNWEYLGCDGLIRTAGPDVLDDLTRQVVHMHLSDHAGDFKSGGVHSNDLVPGDYHMFDGYAEWLSYACESTEATSKFSGTVAIELEANFQPADLLAARSTLRRWLHRIARSMPPDSPSAMRHDLHAGAVAVIDLGNSTSEFYSNLVKSIGADGEAFAALGIQRVVGALCDLVRSCGGSVMSFTGDGVIALFEDKLLPRQAALRALRTARESSETIAKLLVEMQLEALNATPANTEVGETPTLDAIRRRMTVRTGLHWGVCYVPTAGSLTDKAISRDVVYAARLCAWLGTVVEPSLPRRKDLPLVPARSVLVGATEDFHRKLRMEENALGGLANNGEGPVWTEWGFPPMKGLDEKLVYLMDVN